MVLTPQREKFAQGIADGLSQADAYRAAYPKSANWKAETVHQAASRMMTDSKVLARISALRAELAEKQLWKREDSVRTLRGVVDHPDRASDIVAAVKELNAMHGYNEPTRIDHTNSDGSLRPSVIEIIDLTSDEEGADSDTA